MASPAAAAKYPTPAQYQNTGSANPDVNLAGQFAVNLKARDQKPPTAPPITPFDPANIQQFTVGSNGHIIAVK